jgi:hypothetical protein
MTGPVAKAPGPAPAGNCIPPTIHPMVGVSMKIEVRFASREIVGVPLTVTKLQVPTPPVTV